MILLDTHAWIYYLGSEESLSPAARTAIHHSDTLCLSVISCMEAAVLIRKGKLRINQSLESWMEQMNNVYGLEILPITPSITVTANSLPDFHPDPADRIIVASALRHGMPLVTQDRLIRARTEIQTIW